MTCKHIQRPRILYLALAWVGWVEPTQPKVLVVITYSDRPIGPDLSYLALSPMMKECSRWVRLPSAQSARSLEEGGNLTQGEQLFLHL